MNTKKHLLLLAAVMIATGAAKAQSPLGFVQQENIKVAGVTADSMTYTLAPSQQQSARIYYDGLGRPIQTIAIQSSPAGNDIVQPIVYDALGRQTVSYLPYAGQATDTMGSYRGNALTAQAAFYNQTSQYLIATDTAAHARQVFENSPLQRLLQSGSAGAGYQPTGSGTEYYKTVSYRPNSAATDGNIYLTGATGTFSASSYYADGALWVTDGRDEDGHESEVFTDRAGRTILKRQITGSASRPYDTYYVYNYAGMLKYIVPPKAVSLIINNGYTISSTPVANLVYAYTYNTLGLPVSKTIPGKGTTFIIYDPQNRPLLARDSAMAARHQWYYIKYDVKNRPVESGVYTDASHTTYSSMLAYVNSSYGTAYYEARSTSSTYQYYTNNVFPTGTASGTSITPLTYSYYDNYDLNYDGVYDYSYQSQGLAGEEAATTDSLKGLPTMSLRLAIGPGVAANTWLLTVNFYDRRGNLIQARSNNQLYYTAGTLTDSKTTVPDFTGKPLVTKTVVVSGTGPGATNSVASTFNYDNLNMRLSSIDQVYNTQPKKRIAAYVYNELGQLIVRRLDSLNGAWLQNVDYRYNIRGQMTSINNSSLSADTGKTNNDSNDLFGMQIMYDHPDTHIGSVTPSHSGMVSAVKWMTVNGAVGTKTNERSYAYNYDKLGRDTSEWYAERTAGSTSAFNINNHGFDEYGITYDEAGNILTLKRTSSSIGASSHSLVDNLAYTYDATLPNQLDNVSDATGNSSLGFRNLASSSGNYTYDNDGNLLTDPYKGLNLKYSTLVNRVDSVMTTLGSMGGAYFTYTYDATGSVIRKQLWSGPSTLFSTIDYVGGFVYTTASGTTTLSYIQNAEGRLMNTGSGGTVTLTQEYVITDNQGNARFSFEDNGTGIVIRQENSYYAFGEVLAGSPVGTLATPNINLYNGGSEWQNLFDNMPDWHQAFFRNYDPAIGRFIAVDPKPESADNMTVYQYAGDNPIMMNDPMGDLLPMPGSHNAPYAPWQPVNYGTGAPTDLGWQDQGAFDDGGPFSGDGGAAGAAFWGDYTSQWENILSGTVLTLDASGHVVNNHINGGSYITGSYFNDPTGTRVLEFASDGSLAYSFMDYADGPHGLIAYQAGQGDVLSEMQVLQNLGLAQTIDLSTKLGSNDNQGGEGEAKTAENVGTIIGGTDNAMTLAGVPHYLRTGEEVGGVLKWAGRVTGVASVGNNLYKAWNERKTNGWQAALHFTEAVGQAGFMIFGGEEAELAWNLVSDGVDIGIDYYNHSHGKE